jgi:hypothetical protein
MVSRVLVMLAAFALALCIPELPGGLIGASPAGPLTRQVAVVGAGVLCALMLWRPARKVPWACVLVIVAAGFVKAGLWGTVPVMGWQGRYQTEEANPERAESFWHWRVHDHKLDRAIQFTGLKTGLVFLNAFRYCCTSYDPSREIALPIHASWRGYVFAGRDQRIAFEVEVNGPVNVIVREAASGVVEPPQMPMSFQATVSGWHVLDIAYIKPAARPFDVSVHATVDGAPALIALQPAAPTDGQRAAARVLDVVLLVSFAIGLAWAWLPTWRARSTLRTGYLLPAIAVMCVSAVFLTRGASLVGRFPMAVTTSHMSRSRGTFCCTVR